jgi:NAD(P)-dependent dehydrogenase (short-subunit alcohol dehydrogenase family)
MAPEVNSRTALITGGSRGIGAETAVALARRGYDVAITYRNKAARAEEVARAVRVLGTRCLVVRCEITNPEGLADLSSRLALWTGSLSLLVLNASGGLERDLLAADPDYPTRVNCTAQLDLVDSLSPFMPAGGTIVFVTSHWAHLHGHVQQLPAYEPIARSKHAGEQALRARQEEFAARGIRLLVVTGDLIEGTITPKLLERAGRGMMEQRRDLTGGLPTAAEMGEAIAAAATDDCLASGETVVVGGDLDSLERTDGSESPAGHTHP